jgi:hypothetical protein
VRKEKIPNKIILSPLGGKMPERQIGGKNKKKKMK